MNNVRRRLRRQAEFDEKQKPDPSDEPPSRGEPVFDGASEYEVGDVYDFMQTGNRGARRRDGGGY